MKNDLEKHQKLPDTSADTSNDPLAVTPLAGNRQLKRGERNVYTSYLEEAFERITQEVPEDTLLFLNEKKLRERAKMLKRQFMKPEEGGSVAYAVKANSYERILKILGEEGINTFDCASIYEIAAVLHANPDSQILYNHPIKKEKDIRWAIKLGVTHFTVQTLEEVQKILENSSGNSPEKIEMAVRLDTPNPHAGINLSEKYGASDANTRKIMKEIKSSGSQLGISIHTGSQNTDPEVFCRGIKKMIKIAIEEGGVRSLNIGGGLPANILEHDRFNVEEYMTMITDTIRASIRGAFQEPPKIYMEPGRAMVAESVDLLIPILSVEERHGERVVYMDDGVFTSFSDAIIHDWKYDFRAWKPGRVKHSGKKIPFRIFGRTCDSGDSLGMIHLPEDIQSGDYLHVPTAGAYTDSQSTQFNGFLPPEYISYNTLKISNDRKSVQS